MQGRNIENGHVPLHEAAKHGNLEAVQELLAAQAPLLPRTSSGEFPFDLAKEAGQTAVEQFLLDYKLPPASTSREHWYHGTLKRDEAVAILQQFAHQLQRKQQATGQPVDTSGCFLVRYSESPAAAGYVLTLLSGQVAKNFLISQADLYQNGNKLTSSGVCRQNLVDNLNSIRFYIYLSRNFCTSTMVLIGPAWSTWWRILCASPTACR